ncbi:MAG: M20/M25/M40 family metallo-hydrolase [Melioribacteraceae bacterium]|nr:M20/M25/M40 family metallo-hydrolase [Melioribacteraceae bacterium]
MKKNILYLAIFVLPIFSNLSAQNIDYDYSIIKANIEFLADDLLEGREAASRSEKIASLFIAKELQKYGIQPFGDDGSYFQQVPLQTKSYSPESSLVIENDDDTSVLNLGEDLIRISRGTPSKKYWEQNTDLVFGGFGITAEEYNYDDYAELDLNGKTVVLALGEPYSEREDFFEGEKDTDYSRSAYKIKNAQKKGAVGVLFLPSERVLSFWDRYKSWTMGKSFALVKEEGNSTESDNLPSFAISKNALEYLFEGEEVSFAELDELLKQNISPAGFEINKKVTFHLIQESKIVNARNVVGILNGTDEKLKDEYVTVGAHYDHVGTAETGEDKVYNGADDNASGTVAVLESARTLAEAKNNRRPVVFVFHTAEEKGLLGAEYFTNNSKIIDQVIANINMDMVGRENVDSIYNIGSYKLSTQFGDLIKKVNEETVKFNFDYRFDAPDDPNRFYSRSDHYHYAKRGIPIVFFFDWMKEDYHKLTDEVAKINFTKIKKVSLLTHNIVLNVANLDEKPVVDHAIE